LHVTDFLDAAFVVATKLHFHS